MTSTAAVPASSGADDSRLIVVSNRLPVVLSRSEDGWRAEPGSGGLVSAMLPVLRNRGGMWIGWPGTHYDDPAEIEDVLATAGRAAGYELHPVRLSAREEDLFYHGFSNEILWPLFHDSPSRCVFQPDYWEAYSAVNRRFAEITAAQLQANDFVWLHDYHLLSAAHYLRDLGVEQQLAFFLHIPFPPPDIFMRLPWRKQVLQHLLEYDLIGFHTLRDRRNFIQCLRQQFREVRRSARRQVVSLQIDNVSRGEGGDPQWRELRCGIFPISIDFKVFQQHARSEAVMRRSDWIRSDLRGRKLMLAVSRLDYSKGIPESLEGYARALRRYPELHRKIIYTLVVVPSRRSIPEYAELKSNIERLVGEINGEFTDSGWVPVHYLYRSLPVEELVAYYRTADIGLIMPLKDGMNLIAKEYCAAQVRHDGVLILSEFAGAAAELGRSALLVNPHDFDGVADAIVAACDMPVGERRARMRALRRTVRNADIFRWVEGFIQAATSRDLSHYPIFEETALDGEADVIAQPIPAMSV